MVLPLDVALELRPVEVHVAQVARRVATRLIVEVRRPRIAALASRRHRLRAHAIAELDDGDEAVAGRAVHPLRAARRARTERGERAPPRRGESDGNARPAVIEGLDDVARETLEAVDVAPRRLPRAE